MLHLVVEAEELVPAALQGACKGVASATEARRSECDSS